MTTQPTTGPTAADTTTSARETLHHLAHLTADPYIPEAHDDEDELYRDDVRDVLAAHGWTEGPDGFLRKGGALWTETNRALDSGLDGPGGQYVIEFTSEVPGAVIAAACLAAAGVDVPALLAEVDRLRAELSKADRLWRERETENGKLFDKLMAAENGRDTLRERVAELDAELEGRPSRAEVLREAADHLADAITTNPACRPELHPGVQAAIDELRRMAAAAPAGAEDGDRRA